MNQSKLGTETCNWRKAREKVRERVTIGSVLVLLLIGWQWREFYDAIAWRSNAKPKLVKSKPSCQVPSASVLPEFSYVVICISRIFKSHSNFTLKYNDMGVVFDHE